jgi:hypothetical protein
MSATSPSPWTVELPRSERSRLRRILDAEGNDIAQSFLSNGFARDMSIANAHLIAAAPDLLEALTMVRDADEDLMRDGVPGMPWPARRKIDAAIAKAEGRA